MRYLNFMRTLRLWLYLTANVCDLSRKVKVIVVYMLIILKFFGGLGCGYIPHANNISGNARIQRFDFRILGRFLATRKVDATTGSRKLCKDIGVCSFYGT